MGLGEINRPGHVGIALFEFADGGLDVTICIGHALSPASAGGTIAGDHADGGDDHGAGEIDDHDAPGTPSAGA